ncbi:MAG TPA: META domain-containing protein [Gammaproteobacteria bacterium]|nr:META domain-containing protein [Gammaproteobacteria bacterium]
MTRFASTALISAALALAACQRVEDAPVPTVTPDAEVGVQPARADDGASDGTMTDALWRLVAIRRPGGSAEPVAADPSYYVEFRADAHYAGRAHCNSFTGEYEHPAPGVLHIRAGAATLAACPQPSIADEYLRALASVTHYEVTDDELRLSYNTSGELKFHRLEIEFVPEVHFGFELAPARTLVYDCDGDVSFTVREGPGEVALWAPEALGGTYQVLSLARSGSGVRYVEGDTVFWNKGNLATIEIAGQRFVDCRSNPSKALWADAKRRGATFRALGNEPGWYIEIFADRIVFGTQPGTKRMELEYVEPIIEGTRRTYRASGDGYEGTVVIDRRGCVDTMSGEGFEAAATVSFENRTLRGCGRFL